MRPRRFPVGTGSDPVEEGLVESLGRPGGNVTGVTNLSSELGGKRLELLKEAVPKLGRVAVLYNPVTPGIVLELKEVQTAARTLGVTSQPWEVRPEDVSIGFLLRWASSARMDSWCSRAR
jgi:putative tryptophan/tyrosine transport system substrate-binding protein